MRAHMQVCVPRLQVWLMAAQSTQASPSEPQKDELNPGSQVFLTLRHPGEDAGHTAMQRPGSPAPALRSHTGVAAR